MTTSLRAEPGTPIEVRRLGVVPYREAWELQRELVAQRAADHIGDTVLLLEHPPVYTLGSRADETNIRFTADERAARGIEVVPVDRGGDVTYHGPGQLVGYPIMRLDGPRVVDFVRALEAVNIEVLAGYGLEGTRIPDYTGVWVGRAKLTAIGVRVSTSSNRLRRPDRDDESGPRSSVTSSGSSSAVYVTQHGWATNVTTDLDHFDGIVACGISDEDKSVGTLASLGVDTDVAAVGDASVAALARVFDTDVVAGPSTATGDLVLRSASRGPHVT